MRSPHPLFFFFFFLTFFFKHIFFFFQKSWIMNEALNYRRKISKYRLYFKFSWWRKREAKILKFMKTVFLANKIYAYRCGLRSKLKNGYFPHMFVYVVKEMLVEWSMGLLSMALIHFRFCLHNLKPDINTVKRPYVL